MKKKKFLSAVLAAGLLASTVPATAWASEPNTEPVATEQASVRSGELTVSGDSTSYEWQNNDQTLMITGSEELTISGDISRSGKNIQIKNGVTANLNFSGVTINNEDAFILEQGAAANIDCSSSTIAVSAGQETSLNLTFTDGNNSIRKISSDGAVTFDATSDTFFVGYIKNQLTANSLIVNGGYYGVSDVWSNIDNLTINDGVFTVDYDCGFSTEKLSIHGGYFCKDWPQASSVNFYSEEYLIDGGTFVGDCDIAANTVWEMPVATGSTLAYQVDDRYLCEYQIVDDDEVINHYDVTNNSSGYNYNGRVLMLNDGANVTVSSNGQVCDQIAVGTPENPANASLTLNGVDFKGPMAGIVVNYGSNLTLTLNPGSDNSIESIDNNGVGSEVTPQAAAIQIEDNTTLTIRGDGDLMAKASTGAAGIGAGASNDVDVILPVTSTINIEGGNIISYGAHDAAAIGDGGSMTINISGGNVKAYGSEDHLASTDLPEINGISGANINISGGTVKAVGSVKPAIGFLGTNYSRLEITGGKITAQGTRGGTAISADDVDISGKNTRVDATASQSAIEGKTDLTISGGEISAESERAAGICSERSIEISGGTVESHSGKGYYGIESKTFSTGNGNPVIITNSISDHNSESVWNGVFLVDNMNGGVGKVYGNKVTPTNDFTIPEGKTLEVDAGQSLIVAKGITATNNGTVIRDAKGAVDVQGTWRGNPVVVRGSEEDVAVTGVQLNKRTLTLAPTATETLVATISPDNATNKSLRWSSSDSDVATVDANGKVTAVAEGQAVITVSTVDGGFTAQCTVTVSGSEEEKPGDETTNTETTPDGSTVTTTVDKNGVSTTTIQLSETIIEQAERNDAAVTLPMDDARATTSMSTAPSVTVDLPGREAVKVEIPVRDLTPGTVAVLVDARGNETVIKNSVIGNNGLIVTLADGDTVKILDNTQEYGDVAANHWAKGNIDYVTSRGLFVGVDDENFAPETSMTRAMIVSVLQRYAGDTTSASGDWYEGARQWAMENGISDGTNMNGNVTREQLVTMLYRYIGSPQVVGSLADYSDNASVSPYAEQAMVWAVRNGIIGGMTADTLAPQGLATRAQVAAILERFIAWEQA